MALRTLILTFITGAFLNTTNAQSVGLDCYTLTEDQQDIETCEIMIYKDGQAVKKVRKGHLTMELEPNAFYTIIASKRGMVSKSVFFNTHSEITDDIEFPLAIVMNYDQEDHTASSVQVASLFIDDETGSVSYRIPDSSELLPPE